MMINIFEGEEVLTPANVILTIFILCAILIVPVFPLSVHKQLFTIVFTLIFLSAPLIVRKNRKRIFTIALALILLEWTSFMLDFTIITIGSSSANIAFFILMVILLVFQVAKTRAVSLRIIIEAVNVYLLLGMVFSLLVLLLMALQPDSFAFPESAHILNPDISHFSNYLYYAFVTFTTLGYGDVAPVSPFAKSLAILMAITGQLYIAIVIATLVGKFSGGQK